MLVTLPDFLEANADPLRLGGVLPPPACVVCGRVLGSGFSLHSRHVVMLVSQRYLFGTLCSDADPGLAGSSPDSLLF